MSKIDDEVGFASALRAGGKPENPREQLRNLIAGRVRRSATALADLPYDVVPYIADAVMELFAFVTPRDVCVRDDGTAWEPLAATPTHRDFEIRTVPTAVGTAGGGQPNASDLQTDTTRVDRLPEE